MVNNTLEIHNIEHRHMPDLWRAYARGSDLDKSIPEGVRLALEEAFYQGADAVFEILEEIAQMDIPDKLLGDKTLRLSSDIDAKLTFLHKRIEHYVNRPKHK